MTSHSRIGKNSLLAIGWLIVTGVCTGAFDASQDEDAACVVGSVENLGPGVNSPFFEGSPTVSANERVLFLTSNRANGQEDLFVSTCLRRQDPWGEAVNLGPPVNTAGANENGLRLSLDAKTLYFSSNRQNGFGSSDLYVATRQSMNHPWDPVTSGLSLVQTCHPQLLRTLTVARVDHLLSRRNVHSQLKIALEGTDQSVQLHCPSINGHGRQLA
jgi:WD40-like Beta Propeller Repeat